LEWKLGTYIFKKLKIHREKSRTALLLEFVNNSKVGNCKLTACTNQDPV